MNHRQATTLWSTVIVEELVRQGAGFFCISPGSRSTPLTVAAARNPKARRKLFPDERSAGFFALGHARATGKPAVLVCTSGTAVANYYPSVVEASMDNQPMLILSADRPFELLECGSNQTIRQENLFGSYTRWHMQLPAPSVEIPLKALLSTIGYAVSKTLGSPAGPVHLNLPFREPLEPETPDLDDPWFTPLSSWHREDSPSGRAILPERHPDPDSVAMLQDLLSKAERPMIVAGSLPGTDTAIEVAGLARDLQVPLYADLSSGLRLHGETLPWQLALPSPEFRKRFRPDLVLHFGGNLISRNPAAAAREWQPEHHIVIRQRPDRFSPDHNVTCSIEASIARTATLLRGSRKGKCGFEAGAADVFFRFAAEAVDQEALPEKPVTEISASRLVSRLITSDRALFLSNSMPVRDMDSFAFCGSDCAVGMNRGASGIDGIISTAAGFADGLGKPVTLLIGDIAFLHDLNALSLPGRLGVPLQIVVLNNNGGGIFSFLPVSECTDIFETHFATPQDYSIRSAAETFGIDYACPQTNAGFIEIYRTASCSSRSTVIEVKSSRQENLLQHRTLQARINELAATHLCGL
jgi:2-succinyl-5-enolpyruvyl-6-hydroxy-3-cyclohexene-1-carboxylate synthase